MACDHAPLLLWERECQTGREVGGENILEIVISTSMQLFATSRSRTEIAASHDAVFWSSSIDATARFRGDI